MEETHKLSSISLLYIYEEMLYFKEKGDTYGLDDSS